MNFRDMAEQNESWIIEQRRYFHAHPELSFEEKNTTHEIGKCLEEMGLTPHYYPDYNGLWAIIKGGKSTPGSKTVALRADIDALPVEEHTGLTFCSQNPGVMHLDGEPVMADSRIDISIMPQSLHVVTPEVVSFTEEVHNLFGEVTRFFDKKLPYIFR